MPLSADQVRDFETQGFVIAENILTDADLQPAIDAITAFIDQRAGELHAQGEIQELHADKPFLTRFAHLYAQSKAIGQGIDIMQMKAKAIFDFLRNENLMLALEPLLGTEVLCNPIQHLRAKTPARLNEAGPDYFNNVPWHQDSGVTWEEADGTRILTVWIPLVDATVERGCMELLPAVAERGHLTHQSEGGTTIKPELLPDVEAVPAICPKGGAVIMSQFTPHRSTPNQTDWDVRWSLDLRYQKIGTPTGRPFHPEFPARSEVNPSSVLTDYDTWSRRWDEALAEQQANPKKAHRVV